MARGTRLPDTWIPSDDDIRFATESGLTETETEIEARKFLNYWTSLTGTKATKLRWDRTWQNWIMNHKSFRPAHKAGGPKRSRVQFEIIAEHIKRDWYVPGTYDRPTLQACVDAGLLSPEEMAAKV